MRDESALVAVAFAVTLWSSAALSQAEAEAEVVPSQPVETVPTAPPAPSRVVPDEPTASTPPVVPPNTSAPSSTETAPAPLPTGAPTSGPLESALAGSQGFLSSPPTGTTFRDDADSYEWARRLCHGSGCAGWNKGGGAFRAARVQRQSHP